jgi:hypothetical protein
LSLFSYSNINKLRIIFNKLFRIENEKIRIENLKQKEAIEQAKMTRMITAKYLQQNLRE